MIIDKLEKRIDRLKEQLRIAEDKLFEAKRREADRPRFTEVEYRIAHRIARRTHALVLRREGLSYREIGERLGIGGAAAKVLIFRALRNEGHDPVSAYEIVRTMKRKTA